MRWEVGGRAKREETYVYLWLIHVDIWQKPAQYCKAIILQLKMNKKQMNKESWVFIGRTDAKAEIPVLWPPHAKS